MRGVQFFVSCWRVFDGCLILAKLLPRSEVAATFARTSWSLHTILRLDSPVMILEISSYFAFHLNLATSLLCFLVLLLGISTESWHRSILLHGCAWPFLLKPSFWQFRVLNTNWAQLFGAIEWQSRICSYMAFLCVWISIVLLSYLHLLCDEMTSLAPLMLWVCLLRFLRYLFANVLIL